MSAPSATPAPAPAPSPSLPLPVRFEKPRGGDCRCRPARYLTSTFDSYPHDGGDPSGCPLHDARYAFAWLVNEKGRHLFAVSARQADGGDVWVSYEDGDASEREADRVCAALLAAGDACEAHNHGDLAGAIVRASASFLRAAPREVWLFRVERAAPIEGARSVLSEWTTEARAVEAANAWHRAGESCRLARRLVVRS